MQGAWRLPIIILLAVVAYIGALDYGLVKCDDNRIAKLYNVPATKSQSYLYEFTQPYLNTTYYRPLVNISFKADADMYGQEFRKYHRTNLILHALFCILLFYAAKRFTDNDDVAFVFSLIFAVHPLFANAVAWIPGRNDLLLGVFSLSSFIALLKYLKNKKVLYLILNAIFLLMALFSKETAAILPVLFFVYAYISDKDAIFSRDKISLYLAWILAGAIWFTLRSFAETGKDVNVFSFSIFLSNLRVIPEYLAKFFIPLDLSVLPTYSTFPTIAGNIILVALILGIYYLVKENKKLAAWGLLWFILLIIPTTIFQRGNASEWNDYLYCRAYLPMAGLIFSLILITNLYTKKLKKNTLYTGGGALLAFLFFINTGYTPAYQNIDSFYNNAIEKDSSRAFFYEILAVHYTKQKDYAKSLNYFELALKTDSNYAKRHIQVAKTALAMNDFDKAIKYFQSAQELEPENVTTTISLATSYAYKGDVPKAIELYKKGIQMDTSKTDAYFALLFLYQKLKDYNSFENLSKFIIEKKYQSSDAAIQFDNIANQAFETYNIDNAAILWKYAFAFDTTKINFLKKLSAAYYMSADADSCRKYYNMFLNKGGSYTKSEQRKFSNLLGR